MKRTLRLIVLIMLICSLSATVITKAEDNSGVREIERDEIISGARSATLSKDKSKMYIFYLPGGGISTCTVYVLYTEDYNHFTNNNSFYCRGKYYTGQYTYATQCPVMTTGNVIIKNGSGGTYLTFSSWTKVPSMYSGNPDVYGYYENYSTFVLSDTTPYTGQLNYSISCFGANLPIYSDSVNMGLATY